jgi:hypothetical protein
MLDIVIIDKSNIIATYTGLDGMGNQCNNEEAHNLQGKNIEEIKQNSCLVWGLVEEETTIKIYGKEWLETMFVYDYTGNLTSDDLKLCNKLAGTFDNLDFLNNHIESMYWKEYKNS